MGDPSRLEVYEPHTGVWYAAGSSLPINTMLVDHCLVSNSSGGLLLALGGTASVWNEGGLAAAPEGAWDSGMVATYDTKEGACRCSSATWKG